MTNEQGDEIGEAIEIEVGGVGVAVMRAEAILIGDSEVDVQTARNAGALAAAVNYGFGTHDRDAYPADLYLDRLTDLIPLLVGHKS